MSEWVLSENAADDLIEIYVYTYQEFGERQAEAYTGEIEAKFSMLADSPKIGTVLAEIPGDYRQSVFRSHVIVYRTLGQGIFIARVLHSRRDIQRLLQADE